ncbi:hypothetical protein EGW08_014505 [Elysia chlorotica]|uniref:Uncharacterized protein n=1 Tax=Elysia chlorotica TaxID=188477 RepID=A0A433T879_ELYCH|nr:hypothetical protein EGW08_014505 [Elysia chlorotica]
MSLGLVVSLPLLSLACLFLPFLLLVFLYKCIVLLCLSLSGFILFSFSFYISPHFFSLSFLLHFPLSSYPPPSLSSYLLYSLFLDSQRSLIGLAHRTKYQALSVNTSFVS